MASLATYHVRLTETGWAVSEGTHRAGPSFPSKRSAVAEARRLAAAQRAARLVVHYADQTVEREILFHGEARPVRSASRPA